MKVLSKIRGALAGLEKADPVRFDDGGLEDDGGDDYAPITVLGFGKGVPSEARHDENPGTNTNFEAMLPIEGIRHHRPVHPPMVVKVDDGQAEGDEILLFARQGLVRGRGIDVTLQSVIDVLFDIFDVLDGVLGTGRTAARL